MIALAPVALLAAAGVAGSTFSFEHTSAGWELVARSLASLAAVLFAVGYALVICSASHQPEHVVIKVLTRISVVAVGSAALITAYQLLVVNDTVGPVVRVALWALVLAGIVCRASVAIARRAMSRAAKRLPLD